MSSPSSAVSGMQPASCCLCGWSGQKWWEMPQRKILAGKDIPVWGQEIADNFFTQQSLEELQQSWTRALEVFSQQSRCQQNRKNQGCLVWDANHFMTRKGRDRNETLRVSAHQSLSYWSFSIRKWQSCLGACLWENRTFCLSFLRCWEWGREFKGYFHCSLF